VQKLDFLFLKLLLEMRMPADKAGSLKNEAKIQV